MKNKVINIIFITLFLSSPLFAQGSKSESLIIPGVSVGKINANTSEAVLIKLFGKSNVIGVLSCPVYPYPSDPIAIFTVPGFTLRRRKTG
jgi:hypothetical protein